MKSANYDSVYFLGVGGIGMSALARWFMRDGKKTAGFDRTATELTRELIKEGIEIHFEDNVSLIPSFVAPDRTLIVWTPAIKEGNELAYFQSRGFRMAKRSEVLGLISKQYKTIAVAGTHGKTTTSAMIAHILKCANKNMVAFLGGIAVNYQSNLVMHGTPSQDTLAVAEADEFDRSFLRLEPAIAVVTSADADHLDIYGTHENMLASFQDFMALIKPNGNLIIHEKIKGLASSCRANAETYGEGGQFYAENISAQGGVFKFDFVGQSKIQDIELGIPGFHNMENAIAAIRAALLLNISAEVIRPALAGFRGVKRRFEFIVRREEAVYIDDYAHHPAEIEAFIKSVRHFYPSKKLTVIFQPHLFTRTRDFAAGFSESLSLADEVLLLDIYPAREKPISGVTSDILFDAIASPEKERCSKEDVLQKLRRRTLEVVATVGAGDIDTLVEPIKNMLLKK